MEAQRIERAGQAPDLDEAVDEAIRLAGGNPRDAIRGLILGQQQIEAAAAECISAGYVRRRR